MFVGKGAGGGRKLTSGVHLAVREAAEPSCRRGKRGEEIRGSEDIPRELANSAPPCQAAVACHISQNGKIVRDVKQE